MSNLIDLVSALSIEGKKVALKALANSAAFTATNVAFNMVMKEDASAARTSVLRRVDSTTARGMFDLDHSERQAPAGLESLFTPDERLRSAASLYIEAASGAEALAESAYDLPMTVEDMLANQIESPFVREDDAAELAKFTGISKTEILEARRKVAMQTAEQKEHRRTKILSAIEQAGHEGADEALLDRYMESIEERMAEKIANKIYDSVRPLSDQEVKEGRMNLRQVVVLYGSANNAAKLGLLNDDLSHIETWQKDHEGKWAAERSVA